MSFNFSDLLGIGRTLKTFAAELQAVLQEKETLLQRREEIRHAPAPRSDVAAAIDGVIDRMGQKFAAHFQRTATALAMAPTHIGDALEVDNRFRIDGLVSHGPGGAVHSTDVDSMVAGLFGDALKQIVRDRLEAMPWPQEAGFPVAARELEIGKVEARLKAVQAAEDKLRESARAAGLAVE